jgi:hypothetical protein
MFLPSIALCALCQVPVSLPQPVFPIGARPELHQLVEQIHEAQAKGDSAAAANLAANLPKPELTLGWDDSAVPANMRDDVLQFRDRMIAMWERMPGVHIKVLKQGDVNISFQKVLSPDIAGLPMESKVTFGTNPRIKAIIGLSRGNPPQSIIPAEAGMEIAHAIGAFFGNADDSLPGNCMFRNNVPAVRVYGPTTGNLKVASQNIAASDAVRDLLKSNQPVDVSYGRLSITPTEVKIGQVPQGKKVPIEFSVTNTGNGDLSYNLVPDCGCFTKAPPGTITAGSKSFVTTVVDTLEYVGEVHKMLVLYTNDPDKPVLSIPVSFISAPPCRLYRPEGDSVILPVPNDTINVFLTIPAGSNLKPGQYDWTGMDASVTMEPWSGSIPDPELDEPSKARKGYVFHIKVGKKQISGHTEGVLHVTTDDNAVPDLRYTINAQKGIVASPEEGFIGEMSSVTRHTIFLSRPGKPFKIIKVDTGTKCLTATITPNAKQDEVRVDLIYDGSAPKGDFAANIRMTTNDPTQPEIEATVRGIVQ